MKGKAHADDFQAQDFVKKKKKKKRKQNESNNKDENAESVEDPELGYTSPVLFEDAAAGRESRKKKKKLRKKAEKHQAVIDNYCVKVRGEISNGTGAAASPRKKRKRSDEESPEELSDVSCVPVNQHCQEATADYIYFKKHKKKKKEKQPEEEEEEEEVCEPPPLEEPSTGHKEKSKKKKKKKRRREDCEQEDTKGAAEQALVVPSEQGRGHRGCHSPAGEDEGSDAASAFSDSSVELPAGFSKPSKAAERAGKAPALGAKKAKQSSTSAVEESFSESDGMTPTASASHKKKKQKQQNNSFTELAASDEVSVDGEEGLDPAMTSATDLDSVRQELEEFIPHVKNISDCSVKKMAGRDLMRFKEFKKQGITVKFGKFTQKENKQIRKNVEEFLSLTGIDSAEKLLFTSRYPEDKGTIHHLKTKHHFCEKISEGIPRPWRLIYYRARKMFDPNNYKGKYTEEEKEKLKKYQALHGNDWKKISELMSRSTLSVAMKFSEIKSPVNYGSWTKEETRKLMNAVKEVLKKRLRTENPGSVSSLEESGRDLWIEREKLYQPLPWTEIETKVGSRFWGQCKQKWSSILASKLTRGTNGLRASINLIKRLYETKAEDANEVNWDELSNAMGGVPRAYVHTKFYKLKVSYVPLWKRRTFSEIVEYLYEKKLPELEERLEKEEGRCRSFGNSAARQQPKAFRFSDIFDSSEESD